jgi:hypothetical protein
MFVDPKLKEDSCWAVNLNKIVVGTVKENSCWNLHVKSRRLLPGSHPSEEDEFKDDELDNKEGIGDKAPSGISGVPWAGLIAISNRGSMIKTE